MKSKFDFSLIERKLKKMKIDLPEEIANDSIRYFNDSFKKQGWDSNSWRPRKKVGKKPGKTLIQSGALRRSVKKVSANFNKIVIGSYLPYSQIHNEGFNGIEKVKSYTRRNGAVVKSHDRHMIMPQRQFMGYSPILNRQHKNKILKMIKFAFK